MSEKEETSITVVGVVCGMFAWIPLDHLMFGGPKPIRMIVTDALGLLVWWAFLFFFWLTLRDTILRRGKWCIDLKRAVCSQCGKPLQKVTILNWLQWLWSGWSCRECGFHWNKWGRPVKEPNNLAKWAVLRAVGDAEKREHRRQHLHEPIQTVNDKIQQGDAP